jgi:transaldolase
MGTRELHAVGQRLWLDNIHRELLDDGSLVRYSKEFSITGLTSNSIVFDAAIARTAVYDSEIRMWHNGGISNDAILKQIVLSDLRRAANLFRPLFEASDGLEGWVSMDISPLLANDVRACVEAARQMHQLAHRPNLLAKIPGTPAGIKAFETSIYAGIPVNVTHLFSLSHYQAAAEAYVRALERRLATGLDLRIASIASIFISGWDAVAAPLVSPQLKNQLGITIGRRIYAEHCELLASARWQRLVEAGARPQRLLWASMGNNDKDSSHLRYVDALVARDTIIALPEKTLRAVANDQLALSSITEDSSATASCLQHFKAAGVDIDSIARQLQLQGVEECVKSWQSLLGRIAEKSGIHVRA